MEDIFSLLLVIPIFFLVIKKPIIGIYLFILFYEIEKYAAYFYIFEIIVPFTTTINKYLIFILFFVIIKQNQVKVSEVSQIKTFLFFWALFFFWSGLTLFWTDYDIVVEKELKRLINFISLSFAIYFTIKMKDILRM